jgi:hypothetical protein
MDANKTNPDYSQNLYCDVMECDIFLASSISLYYIISYNYQACK